MSRLEIILSAIVFVSMLFNVGIFIYARNVVSKLLFVADELGDLNEMISSFAQHLKDVYELDMFYGDETLSNLLNHAISFNEQMSTFEEIYSLTEEEKIDNKDPTPQEAQSQENDEAPVS
tara:strand:+ start:49956 stop:50315 length:360 start_codon:yes stop_codon:yes gene_type:complete